MSSNRFPLLAAAALLCGACSATAPTSSPQPESRYGPSRGESELSFAGSLSVTKSDPDGASSTTDKVTFAQVGGGYFLSDEQEVGGQVIAAFFSPDVGDDATSFGIYPYYRWNFRSSQRSWFYVGAQAGLQQIDAGGEDDISVGLGFHGGFKAWVSPRVAFFVEPRFNWTEFSFAGTDTTVLDLTTLVGLSFTL